MTYIRFFFGTPQRVLCWIGAVVIGLGIEAAAPGLLAGAVGRFLTGTVQPIMGTAIYYAVFIAIIWFGFRFALNQLGSRKKKR